MPCHHVAEVAERFLVASRVPMAFRLEAGCSAVAVLERALGGDRWNRRFQNARDRSHEGGRPKKKGLRGHRKPLNCLAPEVGLEPTTP